MSTPSPDRPEFELSFFENGDVRYIDKAGSTLTLPAQEIPKLLAGKPEMETGLLPTLIGGTIFFGRRETGSYGLFLTPSQEREVRWRERGGNVRNRKLKYPDLIFAFAKANGDRPSLTEIYTVPHRLILESTEARSANWIGNVHSGGDICWGNSNFRNDVREADFAGAMNSFVSSFFSEPFNNDLGDHTALQEYGRSGNIPNNGQRRTISELMARVREA